MPYSVIAALVYGVILFFLIMVGIELALRSYEKTLTILRLKSALHSFEKIKLQRNGRSHRKPKVLKRTQKINTMRYALHFGIVLSVSFVLFSGAYPPGTWQIMIIVLFIFLTVLDIFWRRLIARG